jgi:hypothetical protein
MKPFHMLTYLMANNRLANHERLSALWIMANFFAAIQDSQGGKVQQVC